MNDIVKIGGKLAAICAVAAISLGLVNAITEPKIELMKRQKLLRALEKVAVGMNIGEYVEVSDSPVVKGYYPITDNGDHIGGYIFKLVGLGYGGDLNLIAGISNKGEILSGPEPLLEFNFRNKNKTYVLHAPKCLYSYFSHLW